MYIPNKDLISIIIPIYNVEDYLVECIESVRNQTYDNIEIILVDDGSTDGCASICDDYANKDDRIVVVHKENGGLSDARNFGMERASGNYIGFVDSDDYIAPSMYEKLYSACIKYDTKISCVRHDEVGRECYEAPDTSNEICLITSARYITDIVTHSTEEVAHYSVCTRLYHRSLLENHGFTVGRCFEDVRFSLEVLSEVDSVAYIDEVGYHYRIRSGSITNSDYNGKLDKRVITDLIPEEEMAIDYMTSRCESALTNIVKASFYEDVLYYRAVNPYAEYNDYLDIVLKKWKLNFGDAMGLPFGAKRLRVFAKMLLMHVFIAYFGLVK